jgi:AraC-like DNA-binding protein
LDVSVRISEVVFAAGFGSIPRFNSVFKRRVGMSPTEYRATLHSSVPM